MRQVNTTTAYILWGLWLFGLGGLQRFYSGQFCWGLFYLLTWGGFGIGQILDLAFIPGLVERRNRELSGLPGGSTVPLPALNLTIGNVPQPQVPVARSPMQRLIRAAKENGGELSMAQAVFYTEMEPEEVKQVLLEAQRSGVAEIGNDPSTGAIRYKFDL